jgi:hypothetical protein
VVERQHIAGPADRLVDPSKHEMMPINSSASLKKILNLNETVETSETEEAHANGLHAPVAPILDADGNPIWKVLVFDDLGRDVISSVLRVSDLRSMGVTMHMSVLGVLEFAK